MSWDVALGYFTGLRLLSAHIQPATLVRTALLVHTFDAIMCRLFAHNNGHRKNLWTALGFVFGIWAMGILILLPRRPEFRALQQAGAGEPSGSTPTAHDSATT